MDIELFVGDLDFCCEEAGLASTSVCKVLGTLALASGDSWMLEVS